MDKDEVIKKLDESGVDYEVTAEHEDGFHIIVKFEKEEEWEKWRQYIGKVKITWCHLKY